MQKDPPLFTSACVCACISTMLILLAVALCLSACSISQLKFWEKEAELLEQYSIDESVDV